MKLAGWTFIPNRTRNFLLALGVAFLATVAPTTSRAICASPTVPSSSALSLIGNNPAEIHARFGSVIEYNLQSGNANQVVHALSSLELADLAYLYRRANSGNTEPLLRILARTVDAAGLTKVASAFGPSETEAAVKIFAPAQIAAQFLAQPPTARVSSSFIQPNHNEVRRCPAALTPTSSAAFSMRGAAGNNRGLASHAVR